MNARGSTEVIVASIGLSMGVFSQNLFTMIVAMAVITTMAMPPMLRWALARGCRCARRRRSGWSARSSRRGVSSQISSACWSPPTRARTASSPPDRGTRCRHPRTSGHGLATVSAKQEQEQTRTQAAERKNRGAGRGSGEGGSQRHRSHMDGEPAAVDVTVGEHDKPTEEAVAKEATKGFDLLVLRYSPTRTGTGTASFIRDPTPIHRGLPRTTHTGRSTRRPSSESRSEVHCASSCR